MDLILLTEATAAGFTNRRRPSEMSTGLFEGQCETLKEDFEDRLGEEKLI